MYALSLTSPEIFLISIAILFVGAIGSLIFRNHNIVANFWGNISSILASILGVIFSISILITKKSLNWSYASPFPDISISFNIDNLSAFFILIISAISLVCSLYALAYVKHFYNKYNIGALGFFYTTFIASMLLVVSANNAIFFLAVWEIMSLTSYFLVIYENRDESNVKAGSFYFNMTHAGTAFVVFVFMLLYKSTGSFDFSVIRASIDLVSPLFLKVIFIFTLIGFGVKAGIVPIHSWLPGAHPAAPSHVSALMSGVMIKLGIYMFIRMFFDILPTAPLWAGIVILIIGSVSSLLGVLYALSEHDLKRLLAYHSIENIGIILLGIGSSLIFLAHDMKALATLGLLGALYHTMNHAVFKSLLFLGAGSVVSATHTRNIEEYGGLIKYMPQTALFFLIGSMAISALPPLNGFWSEWITFQSMFRGVATFDLLTKSVFIISIGSLAVTSGLAAACFVKAFGSVFLARPRSHEAESAKESSVLMLVSTGVLSVFTILLGFFASQVSAIISHIANSLKNIEVLLPQSIPLFNFMNITGGKITSSINMPILFISILLMTLVVYFVVKIITNKRLVRKDITWNCGTEMTPRMEITATGFSRSLVTIFKSVLKPTNQFEVEYHDATLRYFPKGSTLTLGIRDMYRDYFYKPIHESTIKISDKFKKIQNGNVNMYVLYTLVTLIGLLILISY